MLFTRLYDLLFSKSSVRSSYNFLISSVFLLPFYSVSYPEPFFFLTILLPSQPGKNEPHSLKSRVMTWRPHFLVPSVIWITFLKGQEGKNSYWVSVVCHTLNLGIFHIDRLQQRSANVFCKGPDSKSFQFGRPYSLCHNYSTLSSVKAARQHVKKWVYLGSNKTWQRAGFGPWAMVCLPLLYINALKRHHNPIIQLRGLKPRNIKFVSLVPHHVAHWDLYPFRRKPGFPIVLLSVQLYLSFLSHHYPVFLSLPKSHWRLWFMTKNHPPTVPLGCHAGQLPIIQFQLKFSPSWARLAQGGDYLWNLECWLQPWTLPFPTKCILGPYCKLHRLYLSHSFSFKKIFILLFYFTFILFFSYSIGTTGSTAVVQALIISYLDCGYVANWTFSLHFPPSSHLFFT